MRKILERPQQKMIMSAPAILGVLLLIGTDPAAANEPNARVRAFASAGRISESGKQTVTIALLMDKGWHIYANPVRNEKYEDSKTEVKVKGMRSVRCDVQYPTGKFYTGKFNLKCMVYQNSVDIVAVVQRAPGDTSPLEIDVKFSACNDEVCLPPLTLRGRPGDLFLPVLAK